MEKVMIANETGVMAVVANLFNKTRTYKCQCAGAEQVYMACLSHKSAKDAASDFAARTDVLSNGYPFLNNTVQIVTVTDIDTGSTSQFRIRIEKTHLYHPKAA